MHADRTNRVLLILLAILLVAAGAAAGAASIGVYGAATEHNPLMANPAGHYIGTNGEWLWPVAAAAAAVLALLALRWLLALLFSTDRLGDLQFSPSATGGPTTLAAAALTEAVAEEIDSYPGVDSARARLIGDQATPELIVAVTLEETADLAALRQRIETGALARARAAVGNPSMPEQLHLTVTATGSATRVA